MTLLEHVSSEVLSCICSSLCYPDMVQLYATNSRILQRKLVSRGCIPTAALIVNPEGLSPESRHFLRNHSNLESLVLKSKPSTDPKVGTFAEPSSNLTDEVLLVVNPNSLKKLVLTQKIPLATLDPETQDVKVFPFLKRFPQLKSLEVCVDSSNSFQFYFRPTDSGKSALKRIFESLEGLETLVLGPKLNLETITLPSTLTSLGLCQSNDQSTSQTISEAFKRFMQQCPSLRHLKFEYASNGQNFGQAPRKAVFGSRLPNKPSSVTELLVIPIESLTLTGTNPVLLKPSTKTQMPNLHSLVYHSLLDAPILSDLLSNHSLTFLSIADPDRTFYSQDSAVLKHTLAKALPATLISLELGTELTFPLAPESAYNFFKCLPRNLQRLVVDNQLASYDWEYLPTSLETIRLWFQQSPNTPSPLILTSSLPCRGLKHFETRLAMPTVSILYLPPSLMHLSCFLSGYWDNNHVKTLLGHLPQAYLVLGGNVMLTESPPKDSLTVDLNELAVSQFGPNAHKRVMTQWVADIAQPAEDNTELRDNSGSSPVTVSTVQRILLPATLTSFSAHLDSLEIVSSGRTLVTTTGTLTYPTSFARFGAVGMEDLVRALSKLRNLTSLTLDTPNPFPFALLSTLPNLTYLDCGRSQILSFTPAWLPKSLTSFTALGTVTREARETSSSSLPNIGNQCAAAKNTSVSLMAWNPTQGPFPQTSISSSGGNAPQSLSRFGSLPNTQSSSTGTPISSFSKTPSPSPSATFNPVSQFTASRAASGSSHFAFGTAKASPSPSTSPLTSPESLGKDRVPSFPPNLTLLVIPSIPLLVTESFKPPTTLKTLSINLPGWCDFEIVSLKNGLPNLTSFTMKEITIARPDLPATTEHVDWDILRASAASIASTPIVRLHQHLSIPQSVKSLVLCKSEDVAKPPQAVPTSPQSPPPNMRGFSQSSIRVPLQLNETLTSIQQLGTLPRTLTRLHVSISSIVADLSETPTNYFFGHSTAGMRHLPPTLTDLLLSPVSCSNRNPFGLIPSGVTKLALDLSHSTTCSVANMTNVPPNLVQLRAMNLMIFYCALDLLPKSLEDIKISGCGGWQDIHLKQLQEHIQPQAQIQLSEAVISGSFLPADAKSLTRKEIIRHTSDALGGRVTCNWVLSGNLALPLEIESLSLSPSSQPRVEPELCLLVIQPLRHLTFLEFFVPVFGYNQALNLPPGLTSLSVTLRSFAETPTLWSALPRTLTRFQYEAVIDSHLISTTHLDVLPPKLLTLKLPTLKPSIEAIHGLPPSLTLLVVPECPFPRYRMLQIHPNLRLKCSVFLAPELHPHHR